MSKDEAEQAVLTISHLHCLLIDSFGNFLLCSPIYFFGLKSFEYQLWDYMTRE